MTVAKNIHFGKRTDMDMTQGGIFKNLVKFSFPLLVGNLFQQLYNMVDTWVIGQRGEDAAYAAVGNVGPIINILIGFFLGLSTGASVVISQYFGSKDQKKVHDTVHTSIALTLILGVVFTVIGVLMTPLVLRLMLHSDGDAGADSAYPFAKTYLIIYFSGIIGNLIYNMCAGILRAIGDSRRPFYFLLVSALTNTALDLLFVMVFDLGVAGVAFATIIAQALSAALGVYVLLRSDSWIKLRIRDIKIDPGLLRQIVKVGIPAGIQTALTAFSNVFVQSYISNTVGDQTLNLAGWTTYSKVDQFFYLPLQSLALAITTFVGQNLGVNNVERAKKGTYICYGIATVCTVFVMVPVMIFADPISSVFKNDPQIIEKSAMLLHNLTPFYLFCCINQVFSGAMRGAGNSRAPMIIMLFSFVAFRQVYLFIMSNFISNELLPIGFGYPAGWICCAVITLIYYKFFFRFDKFSLVKKTVDKEAVKA